MTDEPEVNDEQSKRPRRKARRRGIATTSHEAEADVLVPVPEPEPEPQPAPVSAPTPKQPAGQPQVRRVTLRNRRGQMLTPSILNEDGRSETLKIPPHGSVEVFEDRITDYTRDLAAQGHLSIDPR